MLLFSTGAGVADIGSGRALPEITRWAVTPNVTLRTTLEDWSARDGWRLIWDAKNDYRIRAAADLGPDFVTAVRALSDAVNMTNPDLTVTLYLGNRVIHVQDTVLTEN
jgi:hypothetical protein